MIKALLLDFNGVIINDEAIHHEAYKTVLASEGIDVTDDEYYSRLGMNDRAFTESILKAHGKQIDPEKISEVTFSKSNKWRELVENEIPLFEGIENFIIKSAEEFSLGIVSMARRSEVDLVLDASGLSKYFTVKITAEDIRSYKPDPECYREGFRQIDLKRIENGGLPMVHSECVVIEDSPPGVSAGRAADLQVLGVANTVSEKELRDAGALAVAKRLDDWMPDSIDRVFGQN